MAQQLKHINDVTPTVLSWSVKVLVEDKGPPRQSRYGTTRYQQMTLVDEVGTRILATIFGQDIEQYEKTLLLYDTYIVSNAKVSPANPRFDSLGNKYTWIFTQKSVVTKVLDNLISRSLIIPHFHDFHSLQPSEEKRTVDILAIVIKKYQQRIVNSSSKNYVLHEFGLLNHEQKPVILTLWNNLAITEGQLLMEAAEPMPIIRANKLTVAQHYGISLGSTLHTTIVIDPPIPEAQKLKTWRANNQSAIKDALAQLEDIIKNQLSSIQSTVKLQSISDVARSENPDKFSLKVRVQISERNQLFYYIACEKCHAQYDAEFEWEFDCRRCNQKTTAKPRERVFINIEDDTGSLEATAFGDDAVRVINMNAIAAMEMNNAENPPSTDEMNANLKNKKYLVKLKKTFFKRQDGTHTQYTILRLFEDKQKEAATPVSTSISLGEDHHGEPTFGTNARKRLVFTDEESTVGSSGITKKLKQIVQDEEDQLAQDVGSQLY